jgi:hypothetical protein
MKFLEKWEKMWMAVTFAEANEQTTAKELIKPRKRINVQKRTRIYA